MKVRAKRLCFVEGSRRRPGEVFELKAESNFSERYLDSLDAPAAKKPEASKPKASGPKGKEPEGADLG